MRPPLYETWRTMRQRCNNARHHAYHLYNSKGYEPGNVSGQVRA